MTRYWIGVASHEHVQRVVRGGFAQVCRGKIGTLKYMFEGDGLIYYSPTHIVFAGKKLVAALQPLRLSKGRTIHF